MSHSYFEESLKDVGLTLKPLERDYLDLYFMYRESGTNPEPRHVIQYSVGRQLYETLRHQISLLEDKHMYLRQLEGTEDSLEESGRTREALLTHICKQERSELA